MEPSPVGRLPEEILLQVFAYLDRRPPSVTRARHEPTLELTVGKHQYLKSVSCVSKPWRRIVLALLFKHLKLCLDQPSPAQLQRWSRCPYCSGSALRGEVIRATHDHDKSLNVDSYHRQLSIVVPLPAAYNLIVDHDQYGNDVDDVDKSGLRTEDAMTLNSVLRWVPRFYHGLKDLLAFLEQAELTSKIVSIFVATDKMLPKKQLSPGLQAANRDWRCRAAAAFWQHMFSVLNPVTLSILASPDDLACLTCCKIDTSGDWAFEDMDFHLLTLSQDPTDDNRSYRSAPVVPEKIKSQSFDFPPGVVGSSSILKLRRWAAVSLNEGSFLHSYGTYEFFERGPPSHLALLLTSFFLHSSSNYRPPHGNDEICHGGLGNVRHFTYTGIFPYADHCDFGAMLAQLETLDLQLAPLPESGVLDDKARIGKAELPDCWHELTSTYANLASQLATFQINVRRVPRLKTFVCRDAMIPGLRHELDNIFTVLCLPVWAEMEPGVYKRLKDAVDAEILSSYEALEF